MLKWHKALAQREKELKQREARLSGIAAAAPAVQQPPPPEPAETIITEAQQPEQEVYEEETYEEVSAHEGFVETDHDGFVEPDHRHNRVQDPDEDVYDLDADGWH